MTYFWTNFDRISWSLFPLIFFLSEIILLANILKVDWGALVGELRLCWVKNSVIKHEYLLIHGLLVIYHFLKRLSKTP